MKHLLYLLFCLALCTTASAQSGSQQRYEKALAQYNNGEFTECQQTSKEVARTTDGMLKTSAYRLLALCRLALDDISGARSYVAQMLKNDPYFTPSLGDPQRFIDLINENKSQEAGITTASRQAESLEEAPVPVTLITEDMIQHSGATTLQELLTLYVPGMTVAEGCETNIAMHGIYSLMQDKVLIMVDGHRLNSASTNGEALDYRTSLDKVKQIEVLRGPASSLYGNVALTAVVNIITRKGAQFNDGKGGGQFTGIVGTDNVYGGSFIVGGGNNVLDILGWGSIMYSKGTPITVNNMLSGENAGTNTLYTNGYKGRPSFDIGIKGRWNDFTMSVNLQRSKKVPYVNVLQVPGDQTYNDVVAGKTSFHAINNFSYDKYDAVDGIEPGISRSNYRINLDYSHSFDKFDVSASGFINFENTMIYNVMGDSINSDIADYMITLMGVTDPDAGVAGEKFTNFFYDLIISEMARKAAGAGSLIPTRGAYEALSWSGISYGFQAQALTNYDFLGHGTINVGAQFEQFSLSNDNLTIGGNYTSAGSFSYSGIFMTGSENNISGYLQLKHTLPSEKLIINAGIRYDHKNRFNNSKLDKFSPRFSLIWKLADKISVRGTYNYSFVDAPYLYRASILKIFGGEQNMKPETMHSFDLGATYYDREKHFSAEVSGFYNILNDLCTLNIWNLLTPDPENPSQAVYNYLFQNAGKVRTIGVDAAAQYSQPRFFANFNATWQRIVTQENYIVTSGYDQTYSTPAFHANCTVAESPYVGHGSGFFDGGKLWVRGTIQFQTATEYPTTDLFSTIYSTFTGNRNTAYINYVKAQCNIGLGVSYDWKHLNIDLTVKNLLNNKYSVGAMLIDGTPRNGRQFLAKATIKF